MNEKAFFQDKVIIITGASSGIGKTAALYLAQFNAKLVLAARRPEKLDLVNQEIQAQGGQALAIPTDIASDEDVLKLVHETIAKWGRIDIVIANAGQYLQGKFAEINLESFKQSMAVNFFGTIQVIKSVLPEMYRAGRGHIVIINSLDAKKGIIGDGPYVSAKSALDGFGDVLRQELRETGIKVTSIYPGRVDTPMIQHIKVPWLSPKISPEKVVRAMIRGIKRNKAIVIVPSMYFLLGALNNLVPRLVDWFYKIFKIEGETIARKG